MKILLKQQGKRILLDTSEYELYTDKSKDYSEIVNYLVNSLTHSRGIFHVSSSHKCKFYSGDILSKEYSIKDQEIRSDLLMRECIGILSVPSGSFAPQQEFSTDKLYVIREYDLYFLHPGDSVTVRDRSGVVDDYP